MLRLYGVPVPEPDARRLIATLLADGGDLAASAAALVAKGVDMQLAAIALPIPERGAGCMREALRTSAWLTPGAASAENSSC